MRSLSPLTHPTGSRRIVNDLVEAGDVERREQGPRTHDTVGADRPMCHRPEQMHSTGELLTTLT